MLPKNRLGRKLLKKLKVYAGPEHPHEAQQPQAIKVARVRRGTVASIQYYGTGRRKTAVARVYLVPGTGAITVNKRDFDDYFPNNVLKMVIRQPLLLTETAEKFDILVTVAGGGPSRPGRRDPPRHLPRARSSTTPSCARSSRRQAS